MKVRYLSVGLLVGLVALLVCWSVAWSQSTPAGHSQPSQTISPWKFDPAKRAIGEGGPAPKRDLTGTWAGPGSGAGPSQFAEQGRSRDMPSLTALGKQLMSQNKSLRVYSPAATNDPHVRYCDPFGFPRNMLDEIRGLQIATMPNKIIVMIQYMDVWREIWTDGRTLPQNFGGTENSLDPRFNGYSVGHWEDDYNFIVDTTGLDDRTWLSGTGYPHSVDVHVQERFTRVDHNDLKVSVTVDDPKIYTKPFTLGEVAFRWYPSQQLDEWGCVPSEVQEYLQIMGDPAGSDPGSDQPSSRR